MCIIYHMSYEFNNWRAMLDTKNFIQVRHRYNNPAYEFEVPLRLRGTGWIKLSEAVRALSRYMPEDGETMSVYGKFSFTVSRDENLNLSYDCCLPRTKIEECPYLRLYCVHKHPTTNECQSTDGCKIKK